MEKEFVPYELAVKLKDLGFDEECISFYNQSGNLILPTSVDISDWWVIRNSNPRMVKFKCVATPTWSQAFDWFREKYGIDSAILPTHSTKYIYRLYEQQSKSKAQIYGDYMGKEYKTYEEARKACLKKLIEIYNLKILP